MNNQREFGGNVTKFIGRRVKNDALCKHEKGYYYCYKYCISRNVYWNLSLLTTGIDVACWNKCLLFLGWDKIFKNPNSCDTEWKTLMQRSTVCGGCSSLVQSSIKNTTAYKLVPGESFIQIVNLNVQYLFKIRLFELPRYLQAQCIKNTLPHTHIKHILWLSKFFFLFFWQGRCFRCVLRFFAVTIVCDKDKTTKVANINSP